MARRQRRTRRAKPRPAAGQPSRPLSFRVRFFCVPHHAYPLSASVRQGPPPSRLLCRRAPQPRPRSQRACRLVRREQGPSRRAAAASLRARAGGPSREHRRAAASEPPPRRRLLFFCARIIAGIVRRGPSPRIFRIIMLRLLRDRSAAMDLTSFFAPAPCERLRNRQHDEAQPKSWRWPPWCPLQRWCCCS